MKVVFATGIFPPDIGGPAMSVSLLAGAWSKAGHDVAVVTFSDALSSEPPSEPLPYKVKRVPRSWPVWRRYPAFFLALWRATSLASDVAGRPGPIFAQDAIASGLAALLVTRLRRRRFVLRIAGDFAWEQAQVKHGYRGTLEAFQKDPGIPFVLKALRALQRFVYRRADCVIAPSRYLADLLKGWGVPEARIRLVHNGVHVPDALPAERRNPLRVVTAARLTPWKNIDVLIKAMPIVLKKFPRAELRVIGDGPELARLKELASAPMLEGCVSFAGRLAPSEVGRELSSAGIHALVSSYEGFSHQLVHGFAHGAPTIASRAGGNTELIEDGQNGLLVEPGDVNGLAQALLRFMGNPEFARRCAEEARKLLPRFGIEQQIEKTAEAVFGAPGLRVVLISRDPATANSASPTAERLRAYAAQVAGLEVVVLGRVPAAQPRDAGGYRVRLVDSRFGPFSLLLLYQAVRAALKDTDAGLIVAQDPFETGIVASLAASIVGISCILEDHGAFFADETWLKESMLNRLRAWLGRRAVRAAQGIRAVSQRAAESYRLMGLGVPVEVVPVSVRRFEGHVAWKQGGPFTALYAGRFAPEKNLPMLLEAFAAARKEVPEARLLLVGTGPEEARLRSLARDLGVHEAVEIRSWTSDMSSIFGQADIAVLPSNREGYGRFVAEALSFGLPIVMTDVGLAREIVRNGTEGYVVPVSETALMAQAIVKLAKVPSTRALMSAAARRRSETLLKPEDVAVRVTAFWKKIARA